MSCGSHVRTRGSLGKKEISGTLGFQGYPGSLGFLGFSSARSSEPLESYEARAARLWGRFSVPCWRSPRAAVQSEPLAISGDRICVDFVLAITVAIIQRALRRVTA
eukprot:12726093-Alexandrium_andersonii.AAC.1